MSQLVNMKQPSVPPLSYAFSSTAPPPPPPHLRPTPTLSFFQRRPHGNGRQSLPIAFVTGKNICTILMYRSAELPRKRLRLKKG